MIHHRIAEHGEIADNVIINEIIRIKIVHVRHVGRHAAGATIKKSGDDIGDALGAKNGRLFLVPGKHPVPVQ